MSDELIAPKAPKLTLPKKAVNKIIKAVEKSARRTVRDGFAAQNAIKEITTPPAAAAPPPPAASPEPSKSEVYANLKATDPYMAAQYLEWYPNEIFPPGGAK